MAELKVRVGIVSIDDDVERRQTVYFRGFMGVTVWLLKPLTESENSLILVRVDGPLFPTDIPALRAALDEVERIAREWQADSDGSEEAQS